MHTNITSIVLAIVLVPARGVCALESSSYNCVNKVVCWSTLQASEDDTRISIDPSLHHHQRLEEANRGLDNILSHGADILGNLKDQRFTLKVKFHAHK